MKTIATNAVLTFAALLLFVGSAFAQNARDLQYFRTPGKAGLNVFEPPKEAGVPFDGLGVRVGGDFAIQFQALDHSNDLDNLIELSDNINLPAANLNLDAQLAEGMRLHLRTYLASRHHNESWVKGGYLQIDNLDFVSEGFLADVMKVARLRFGMDEINYGDAHFRRSDNANAIYNPFVGNYIMDAFATSPYAEVTVLNNGFLGVLGLSNGRLNQSPKPGDDGVVLFGKVGVDKQLDPDVRVRLTGSFYHSTSGSTRDYIYHGDRAGGRYFNVLDTPDSEDDFSGRFNPGFPHETAFQINPFVKYQGFEFFGIVEMTKNGDSDVGGKYTQLAGEALYRFGRDENFYVGGRFNKVSGEAVSDGPSQKITRFNVGGGWFMTNNVLSKVEYVKQTYDGAGFTGQFAGAEFSGLMLEAVISF